METTAPSDVYHDPYDVGIVREPYPVHARLPEEAYCNEHSIFWALSRCLGANRARLEGRVALDEQFNRWPEWGIDCDTARLAPASTVRGWEELRIVVS